MNCDQYRTYELGELDEEIFQSHAQTCESCREHLRQDAELMDLARSLKQPVDAPFLWNRIEETLRAEMQRDQRRGIRLIRQHRTALYRIAAVLVASAGLGSYAYFGPEPEPPRLFSSAALERVEEKERKYIEAIEELEQAASAQLAQMDLDLMLLYRDKLETIDAQIARCREALQNNPANTHIRRYLLLALQDKKDTLQEVVAHPLEM